MHIAHNFFEQLQGSTPVRYLCCDNAGENMTKLQHVCRKFNIHLEYTAPNTPQQNGVVERKFVTIRDQSSAMTFNAKWSGVEKSNMWAESINPSEVLTNIVANSRNSRCPDELFFGTRPTIYRHLIQYGRQGWVTNTAKFKEKLAPKATKCTMIGYAKDHARDTYRMYNPVTRKVILSRDIKLDDWNAPVVSEDSMQDTTGINETDNFGFNEVVQIQSAVPAMPQFAATTRPLRAASKAARKILTDDTLDTATKVNPKVARALKKLELHLLSPTKTTRIARTPMYNNNKDKTAPNKDPDTEPDAKLHYVFNTLVSSDPGEPKQYKDATKPGPKCKQWIESIKSEISNFTKQNV